MNKESKKINILTDALTGTQITTSVTKEITLSELGATIAANAYRDATTIKVRANSSSTYSVVTELDLSSTSITSIGDYAFSSCTSLTKITLPSTLTSIGQYAFSGCSNLKTINIPANVTTLNNYAFYNCTALTTITFEGTSKLTKLNDSVFRSCTSLSSITLPSTIVTLGNCVFYGDSKLASINLNNITSFGSQCLNGCRLTSISLSSNITTLNELALYNCLFRNEKYGFTRM